MCLRGYFLAETIERMINMSGCLPPTPGYGAGFTLIVVLFIY
ncbi:YjcZ family sporulation protein [Anaerobacillus sp. HL2]|nr:YjcZ family sporulation protein [Anaerobacillus sp. HL2]